MTADSDGQHTPADILACMRRLWDNPESLILGCRDFDGPAVSARSSFGNKCTRQVFRYLLGLSVSDTQTGLRAIPAFFMEKLLEVKGERFEYETNMLIEAKNLNIRVLEVPVKTIYIEENILCPSYINGKQYDKEYYQFLIKVLGIENLIKKMPYELSGGEQQRVAIARAMLLKPKIIFADEPTGNLDTGNTEIITNLFEKLNKEYNTTFIIVTHEENLIEHCGQVIRLKDGEVAIG